MDRDNGAKFGLGVARKERFQSSFRAEARALSGGFFDKRHKFGINGGASFCQLDYGELARIFWRRRNDARAGPGGFLAGPLPVKYADAQAGARQLERNRSPNHPAAGDRHIIILHAAILAQVGARYIVPATVRSRRSLRRTERVTRTPRVVRTRLALFSPSFGRAPSRLLALLHGHP